jgi:GGDEF domain-containing protein
MMDFASSLAIIAILSWGYGMMRRVIAGAVLAPLLLGVLFGLVAVLQMHAPIQPVPGLIIDLRAVPVVLAGAFLGWSGLLACLGIALAARYGIGGVGMASGLIVITLAGFGGLIWDRLTRHMKRRGLRQLLMLAALTCCSMVAGVILPTQLAVWFYSTAALPLAVMYMVAVPAVGALLERERTMLHLEGAMKAAAHTDMASGLFTRHAFAREVAHVSAAGGLPPIAAVVVLTVQHRRFLSAHWGAAIMGHILGGLRHRLASLVCHGGMLGKSRNGRILIAVTAQELARIDDLLMTLRRAVSDRAIALPGGDSARIRVTDKVVLLPDPANVDATMAALAPRPAKAFKRPFWPSPRPAAKARRRQAPVGVVGDPGLFDKADVLLAADRP